MIQLKKIFVWIFGCLVVLVLLLSIAILFSDRLINQESIKNRIQSEISQTLGGRIEFQRIGLSIFPQPNLMILQVGFVIPKTAEGTLASLKVYPKLWPLFAGNLRISGIDLNTPDITINLSDKQKPNSHEQKSIALEGVLPKAYAALKVISAKAPELDLFVENGRLNLLKDKKSILEIKDIRSRIDLTEDSVNLDIRCNTEPWDRIFLKGDIRLAQDQSTFTLAALKLQPSGLNLSGKLEVNLSAKPPTPSVALYLTSQNLDILAARKIALAQVGDNPVVQDIFHILKAGKLPVITFNSHGNSIKELGKLENIHIKGRMQKGELSVPKVDLDLTHVSGDVTIEQGVLQGEGLEARLGNSLAGDATLKLGLAEKDRLFSLNLPVTADLADLPAVLNRIIDDTAFAKELALVENLKGTATGTIVLGERLASLKTRVDVSKFDLSANYRRLPFALTVTNGKFSYKGDKIVLNNLSGGMGKSVFSDCSLQVDLKKTSDLEIKAGKSSFAMEELFPWLSSFAAVKGKLPQLKTVKGTIALAALSFQGAPSEPEQDRFQAAGSVDNLNITSPLFPKTLQITQGQFNVTPKDISITAFETYLLDAALTVSGTVSDYLKGVQNLDLKLHGQIGPDATEWGSDVIKLPPRLYIQPPISISAARLTWNHRKETTLSGDLKLPYGLRVSADVRMTPEKLDIKQLVVQDMESQASLKLALADRAIDFSFKGNLNPATIDHLLTKKQLLKGRIKGDFQAHVRRDQPVQTTAQGKLQIKDLAVPWKKDDFWVVHDLALQAKKNKLQVETADLSLGGSRLGLNGGVKTSDDGLDFDMDLSASSLNIDHLKQMVGLNEKETHQPQKPKISVFPIRGHLNLKTETLTYEGLTWKPFYADVVVNDETATVSVTQADICGIATPGIITISPENTRIAVQPAVQDQKMQSTIYCLVDKTIRVDGEFNFNGKFTAQVADKGLLGSLNGNFEFTAGQGRFFSGHFHGILASIVRLLSITEIFRGKMPDIGKEGFGFESIHVKATIQNGKVTSNEMIIDGTTMNIAGQGSIDLTDRQVDYVVLVAPLKTADALVNKIPLVRDVMGGSFISIPVAIKGDLKNPEVTPLSPSAIGSNLLGIMKRTLQLPIRIIEPILPEEKKN